MYIVMGGTGHIGSAVANRLLDDSHDVTVVVHEHSAKSKKLSERGATIAVADVHDTDALIKVFRTGNRLFMLNPPADPSTDVEVEESKTSESMLSALANSSSNIEAVVAQSTYGARAIERAGDLSTLFKLEQGLAAQSVSHKIIRAAYFMSNWDEPVKIARRTGKLTSMLPIDLKLPMVDPTNAGQIAAELLSSFDGKNSLCYVEGPMRYCVQDVLNALKTALPEQVFECQILSREQWLETYKKQGFSQPAALSFTRMTELTVEEGASIKVDSPLKGTTSLEEYIACLAAA